MSNDKDFKVKNGIQPASYQESLGTIATGSVTIGGDLANASYDGIQFDVSGRETSPREVEFKPDGTKMYIVGTAGDDVTEYTLSTAWDITSATYVTEYSVSGQQVNPRCVRFKSDGTAMYVSNSSNASITTYTLSTPWSVSSVSSLSTTTLSGGASTLEFWFKSDGTRIFGLSTTSVFSYTLSTAWDVSTASADAGTLTVPSGHSIAVLSDGTKLYTSQETGSAGIIHEFVMTTAYDVSTGSASGVTFDVSAQDIRPYGITLKPDDTKLFMVGNNDDVSQYSIGSTLTTNTLDLSTGSVFEITPTSNIQVGLSNPAASGTVSQGTLLLSSEDSTGVSSAFSTTLYTGDATERDIVTGINLADDGGLLWIKNRGQTSDHSLWDTDGGARKSLNSNSTQSAYYSTSPSPADKDLKSINNNGFSIFSAGYNANLNVNSIEYVSWSFKKQTSFFDVVTWTGTGSARTIPHALSDEVGMIAVKRTSSSGTDWQVFHRALGSSPQSTVIYLNDTSGMATNNSRFNNTLPTNSVFSLSGDAAVNGSGETYVAYVFAHDTSANSAIKCGSYTGTGNGVTMSVDLGWSPQWIMIKRTDGATDWRIIDNVRGIPDSGNAPSLRANSTGTTQTSFEMNVTDTGFSTSDGSDQVNISGGNYIYVAIRNPSASTITYDSAIQFGGGTAPDSPAIGETDVLAFSTRDGGTSYQAMQAIDGAK